MLKLFAATAFLIMSVTFANAAHKHYAHVHHAKHVYHVMDCFKHHNHFDARAFFDNAERWSGGTAE